jgi:predicted DNA-binding transcriptional regulator AlpA
MSECRQFNGAPGKRYLSFARVCDKLSRKKSWLYDKIKTDPTFPEVIHIAGRPALVESSIDAWVEQENNRAVDLASRGEQLASVRAARRPRG